MQKAICENCKWFCENNDTENACNGKDGNACHEFVPMAKKMLARWTERSRPMGRAEETEGINICIDCRHSVRFLSDTFHCPWAWAYKPVDGWTAEQSSILGVCNGDEEISTYHITACPHFEPDGPRSEWAQAVYDAEVEEAKAERIKRSIEEARRAYEERGIYPKPLYPNATSSWRTDEMRCVDCERFIYTHNSQKCGKLVGICSASGLRVTEAMACKLFEKKEEK